MSGIISLDYNTRLLLKSFSQRSHPLASRAVLEFKKHGLRPQQDSQGSAERKPSGNVVRSDPEAEKGNPWREKSLLGPTREAPDEDSYLMEPSLWSLVHASLGDKVYVNPFTGFSICLFKCICICGRSKPACLH